MIALDRKISIALGAAALVFGATGASATTTLKVPLTFIADGTGGYVAGVQSSETGSFKNSYSLTLPIKGATDLSFNIVKGYVSSAALYAGTKLVSGFTYMGTAGKYTAGDIMFNGLAGSSYTLKLSGVGGSGGFLGTIAGVTAVPETATWAMMIVGIGVAGGALRRRAKRDSGKLALA